jgi:hypothetical protein
VVNLTGRVAAVFAQRMPADEPGAEVLPETVIATGGCFAADLIDITGMPFAPSVPNRIFRA